MKPEINLEAIYSRLPEPYRERVSQEAIYASIDNPHRIVVNVMAATALGVVTVAALLPYSLEVRIAAAVAGLLVAPLGLPYLIISLAAERRKKEMENVLPDALLLMSANVKSGLNIEKSFLLSARDEFGPLAEELRRTAMEMFGGKPVDEALEDLESRVKSGLFSETIKLLMDGMESGGNTGELLESSAEDIRNSLELRQEIRSNIRMYVIFILLAAVAGAPLLFSISVYMSTTTAEMWAGTNLGELNQANQLGLKFQQPEVHPEFFEQFSIAAIIAINFFAALIISEIKNSNIKEGAKYIPFMVAASLFLFFAIKGAIGAVMGGFV